MNPFILNFMKTLLVLAWVLVASNPSFAEREFQPSEGCPPTTDCCEWDTTWTLSRDALVYESPDGKKLLTKLSKETDVLAREGKFTPRQPGSAADVWWVKIKLKNGTGWVDGNSFDPQSRCP